MTREHFDQLLSELNDDLLRMGDMVVASIRACMEALRERDIERAEEVIEDDSTIDNKRHDIERRALLLIATQQPLASDLRAVAAILAIATELERIGDYSEGIAILTIRMRSEGALPPLDDINRMAVTVEGLLVSALQAFRDRDLRDAARVWAEDDRVDALYDQVFRELLDTMVADTSVVRPGTYLLWVAHNIERIADRATNIVEQLSFMVTGTTEALHPDGRPRHVAEQTTSH